MEKKKISIIVPCYNEEKVINVFYDRIIKVIREFEKNYKYEIVFIDDGSKDNTFQELKKLRNKNGNIKI